MGPDQHTLSKINQYKVLDSKFGGSRAALQSTVLGADAVTPPRTGLHESSQIRGKGLATQNVVMNGNELGTKHAR